MIPNHQGENHHLRQKKSGLWQARITIDRGSKYVGKRITIGLKTKELREAEVRRDLIITALTTAIDASES